MSLLGISIQLLQKKVKNKLLHRYSPETYNLQTPIWTSTYLLVHGATNHKVFCKTDTFVLFKVHGLSNPTNYEPSRTTIFLFLFMPIPSGNLRDSLLDYGTKIMELSSQGYSSIPFCHCLPPVSKNFFALPSITQLSFNYPSLPYV